MPALSAFNFGLFKYAEFKESNNVFALDSFMPRENMAIKKKFIIDFFKLRFK